MKPEAPEELTSKDLDQIYLSTKASFPQKGLLYHLRADKGVDGNVWRDQSGNGNDFCCGTTLTEAKGDRLLGLVEWCWPEVFVNFTVLPKESS